MSIELVKKYAPYTDELFKEESKTSLLTCTDFDWTGAHSVAIWKISTAAMNDYARNVTSEAEAESLSRYGKLYDLGAQTEEMVLSKIGALSLILTKWIKTKRQNSWQHLLHWADRSERL